MTQDEQSYSSLHIQLSAAEQCQGTEASPQGAPQLGSTAKQLPASTAMWASTALWGSRAHSPHCCWDLAALDELCQDLMLTLCEAVQVGQVDGGGGPAGIARHVCSHFAAAPKLKVKRRGLVQDLKGQVNTVLRQQVRQKL